MNGPSNWQRVRPPPSPKSRPTFGVRYIVACLALYTLSMAGVRFYAHKIGVAGGLLTIVGMYGAVRWYERRQKKVEISPEERIDDRPLALKRGSGWPSAQRARQRKETTKQT